MLQGGDIRAWRLRHPRFSRAAWMLAAGVLFVAITALRFALEGADTPIALLYVFPMAIVAVTQGLVAGALAGLVATAVFIAWLGYSGTELAAWSVAVRGLILVGIGTIIGWMSDRCSRELATSRAVLDALPDPASVKDVSGRYLLVNRALEGVLERSRQEVVGQRTGYAQPEQVAERAAQADREVMETRRPVEFELTGSVPGVGDMTMRTIKAPVLDRRGNVTAIVTIAHDITERVEHERRVAAAARRARSEYERALVDYGRLMRHRLVNPLTVIRGVGETLRTAFADDAEHREELADMLVEQVDRLAQIDVRAGQAGPEERELRGVADADADEAARESAAFSKSIRRSPGENGGRA